MNRRTAFNKIVPIIKEVCGEGIGIDFDESYMLVTIGDFDYYNRLIKVYGHKDIRATHKPYGHYYVKDGGYVHCWENLKYHCEHRCDVFKLVSTLDNNKKKWDTIQDDDCKALMKRLDILEIYHPCYEEKAVKILRMSDEEYIRYIGYNTLADNIRLDPIIYMNEADPLSAVGRFARSLI